MHASVLPNLKVVSSFWERTRNKLCIRWNLGQYFSDVITFVPHRDAIQTNKKSIWGKCCNWHFNGGLCFKTQNHYYIATINDHKLIYLLSLTRSFKFNAAPITLIPV